MNLVKHTTQRTRCEEVKDFTRTEQETSRGTNIQLGQDSSFSGNSLEMFLKAAPPLAELLLDLFAVSVVCRCRPTGRVGSKSIFLRYINPELALAPLTRED